MLRISHNERVQVIIEIVVVIIVAAQVILLVWLVRDFAVVAWVTQ